MSPSPSGIASLVKRLVGESCVRVISKGRGAMSASGFGEGSHFGKVSSGAPTASSISWRKSPSWRRCSAISASSRPTPLAGDDQPKRRSVRITLILFMALVNAIGNVVQPILTPALLLIVPGGGG